VQSDWPFKAFVLYFDAAGNPEYNCTGTVVALNVVLTAGHCTVDETTAALLDPAGFAVVTGSVDWTDQSARQVIPVSRILVNPAYNSVTDAHDAALLVLSTPLDSAIHEGRQRARASLEGQGETGRACLALGPIDQERVGNTPLMQML